MTFNTFSIRSLPPYAVYVGFIILVLAIGAVGGLSTAPEIKGWYATLVKPSFSPPNWLFGPVWTVLYVMIGIVGARLTLDRAAPASFRQQALAAFWVQLALNALWSPVFFTLHAIGAAFVIIICMWIAILATIILAWRFDRLSAALLVPYLCWVSFASLLNAAIVRLN